MSLPDAKKLEELESRITAVRGKHTPSPAKQDHHTMANMAWRMVIELVAGIAIGFGVGYGLDWLFGKRLKVKKVKTLATESTGEAEVGLVFHPMDQFQVTPLFGADKVEWFTITNVTLWMGLTIATIVLILVFGARGRALVPTRSQSIAELAYGFIYKMVEDVTGKDGVVFFPYIMTLFMFILVANFLGLLPMAFTTTSHIAVTAGDGSVLGSDYYRICKKRIWIFSCFLDFFCAANPSPNFGFDRGHILFCAACKPLYSFGRQYDGRARSDQSFCSFCTFGFNFNRNWYRCYAAFNPRNYSHLCFGGLGCIHPSLRFRNSNVCVSA